MNLVFELTNRKSWKSLLIEPDRLLLINMRYSHREEFLEGYNDQGMGRLVKEKKEILLINIAGMLHNENDPSELTIIKHNGKKITLEFANAIDLAATTSFIAGQKKLARRVDKMSFWNSIKTPGIGMLITVALGWVVYSFAESIAKTGTVERGNRRKFTTEILIWFAELLGPAGTLLVTGFLAAVFAFFLFKKIKTPPNQVVYA